MTVDALFKNFFTSLFYKKNIGKPGKSSDTTDSFIDTTDDANISEIVVFGDGNNNDVICSENDSISDCGDSSSSGND